MAPNSADPSDDPLAAAHSAYQAGNASEAGRCCARALEHSPRNPGAMHLMGVLALEAGECEQARHWLNRALELAPQNPQLLCDQARVELQMNHTDEAVGGFEQALAIAPRMLPARLQLASIHHRNGHLEQALHHYRLALEQAPDLAELHNQIGVCEFQQGHSKAARSWFNACLKLDPGHLDALENLGRAELEAREFQAAKQSLQQVLASAPHRAEAHHLLGFVHLHSGAIDAAAESFLAPPRKRFALGGPGGEEPADAWQVTATKLRHDLEQLEHLARERLLAPEHQHLAEDFRRALAALPPSTPQQFFFSSPAIEGFRKHYNRLLEDFRPPQIPGGALNPNLDRRAIEEQFHHQGWVYFDSFLNPRALSALQAFCTRTSIWFEKKFQYEVGASLRNGFCCPLLLQIGEELRHAFPSIFGPHLFSGCFSYKYYQHNVDGHVHADRGAVSLNFWPTADEANLDESRGGLVIWNKRVGKDYFYAGPEQIDRLHEELISAPDAVPATIPYRCNRAMLFYSDVLHRSDRMQFKDSYTQRRVSITYLYGQPGDADPCPQPGIHENSRLD